jgi:hypothetical protein
VTLPLISAGEFFELLRPAAAVLSVLISAFVLASARRIGVRLPWAFVLAIGTFVLPFVVLPLFLLLRLFRRRAKEISEPNSLVPSPAASSIRFRFLLPPVYAILLLSLFGAYFYRDYNTVDAHLARASQAKLKSGPARVIREYRAALAIEDNPHTHKLLGIELAETSQWAEALKEFRLAEQGGEPDDLLLYRIGAAADNSGDVSTAANAYAKFLGGSLCREPPTDQRCELARERLNSKTGTKP